MQVFLGNIEEENDFCLGVTESVIEKLSIVGDLDQRVGVFKT